MRRRFGLRAVLVSLVLAALLPGLAVVLGSVWIDHHLSLTNAKEGSSLLAHRLGFEVLTLVLASICGAGLAWWLSHHLVQRPMTGLLAQLRLLSGDAPGGASPIPVLRSPTAEFQLLGEAVAQLSERLRERERERDRLLTETRDQAARLLEVQRLARVVPWEIGLPDGRMISSPALAELIGQPLPQRLVDRLALVHPDDLRKLKQCLSEAMGGVGVLDVEFRVLRPDRRDCRVHAVGELEFGADRVPRRLFGALQDVSERRRTERTVREHEARQAAAVAAARLGVYDEDLQTGRVVWLGHHEEMWGYALGEFDGSSEMFTRRIHPEDRAGVMEEVESARRLGLPYRCEYRVVWPDHSVHWIVDSGSIVSTHAGEPGRQVGVVMDVTVQKEAQLRIAEMGRRINVLLESTSDGFLSLDRGMRVTHVNRHGATMLGYGADAMVGRRMNDLFSSLGGSEFEVACLAVLRGDGEQHTESHYLPWDRWFENHIYPSEEGLSVFYRDVTTRRRAESDINSLVARLEALRDMDRALLQATSIDGVVLLGLVRLRTLLACTRTAYMRFSPDQTSIRVVWTDGEGPPVFPLLLDLPVAEVGPRLFDQVRNDGLLHLPDLLAMGPLSPVLQRMADHGVRALLAMPLRVDGQMVGIATMWSFEASHFDAGRIGVAEGIVDRLNLALGQAMLRERIERHTAELEQRVAARTADMLAANQELEAFSYSVSHDLRAPLQSVSGFSHALLTHHAGQLDDKARHYLERIEAGTRRMEALIAHLLGLAQMSHAMLEFRRVDLVVLAREIIAQLQEHDPNRHVDVELPDQLPVRGDRQLLRVLLDNLLGNAWKFSSKVDRARIALGVERDATGEPVYFVADNGVGFDMRHADRLFTAFKRLHAYAEFPGTGIGLATVHRIVARHGGRVWAASTPGVETVMRFTLPGQAPGDVATRPAIGEEAMRA